MDPQKFLTTTLRADSRAEDVSRILAASLAAVDPAVAVNTHLRCTDNHLVAGQDHYHLQDDAQIYLAGAGKAAASMAQAASKILGDRLVRGVIVTKDGHTEPQWIDSRIQQIEARHPLPDERGVRATGQIIDLVRTAGKADLILCLISGGGSALLTAPVPEIGLQGLADLTRHLLASGADIHEFNAVRKHLSQVKGGQLARLAVPARVITLILSDVVGDDLDVIASGPTVPDPSTFSDAAAVLKNYNIKAPAYIQKGLRGEVPETPKDGDTIFERVQNVLVGTNRQAAEAALAEAGRRGFNTRLLSSTLTGEARLAGTWLAERMKDMPAGSCWIAGGETTVTLGPDPGLGGRNQEIALAAVLQLEGLPKVLLITLATDGGDGPTNAAGACVSGETMARARSQGLNPVEYLERHDAYSFFNALDDLIRTGPTRTNVNDLAFMFS